MTEVRRYETALAQARKLAKLRIDHYERLALEDLGQMRLDLETEHATPRGTTPNDAA